MAANGSADLVLVNGAVYTVDAARRWARAVAVKDGRIAAVGTDDDVRELVGSGTEVVDLRGRMVLPGFQDAHVHPPASGVDMLQCDLHDLWGLEAYRARIREYADEHPNLEWILGGGWSMDVFPAGTPTKELLDDIVPDRPVFLPNRDGHGAWVNTESLKRAGITRDTPDPRDGRIERDELGEPSGTLHEGAQSLVSDLAPAPSASEWEDGL
ncbi:MAG TPA: amidohydrolase family protein, partial [Actinomycetota bacterium]|nr:amidohydrolase family protein [Actinomycetota bacterium]